MKMKRRITEAKTPSAQVIGGSPRGSDYTIIGQKPYSTHPGDAYLWVVVGVLEKGDCKGATWLYNSSTEVFCEGRYFDTAAEALEDFDKRARYES